MGDIADWTNDSMQDAYPDWMPVGSPSRRRTRQASVKCAHCGSVYVHWSSDGKKWRLFNLYPQSGEHQCRSTPATIDTFDEVPE